MRTGDLAMHVRSQSLAIYVPEMFHPDLESNGFQSDSLLKWLELEMPIYLEHLPSALFTETLDTNGALFEVNALISTFGR